MLINAAKALASTLKKSYPESNIYMEEIEQGMTYPAFIIRIISGDLQSGISDRRRSDISFQIAYITEMHTNKEYLAETTAIFESIDYITHEGIIYKTKGLRAAITNRTLYITGDLTTKLYKISSGADPLMEQVEENINLKEKE